MASIKKKNYNQTVEIRYIPNTSLHYFKKFLLCFITKLQLKKKKNSQLVHFNHNVSSFYQKYKFPKKKKANKCKKPLKLLFTI